MTVKERFSQEYNMPAGDVAKLCSLARLAGRCNEHFCNGDAHPMSKNAADKNENSQHWGDDVGQTTQRIAALVKPYGFTAVEYAGLGPTLKRGEKFVEVPY